MITKLDDDNLHKYQNLSRNIISFINEFKWLPQSYVCEFFTKNLWDQLPESWQNALDNLTPAEICTLLLDRNKDCDKKYKKVWPLSLLGFISTAHAYTLHRHQHQPDTNIIQTSHTHIEQSENSHQKSDDDISEQWAHGQNSSLAPQYRRHVKLKKQHEIHILAKVVADLCVETQCHTVVDVGAGLGHLSRLLALEYGLNVTTVEAVGCHIDNAYKFDKQAEAHLKKKCRKIEQNVVDSDKISNLVHLTHTIDPGIKPEVFANLILENTTDKFALVGLHACGDLGPTIIRVFGQFPNARAIAFLSCCYMKMTCCIESENRDAKNDGSSATTIATTTIATTMTPAYPMSVFLNKLPRQIDLTYEVCEIACHATENYLRRLKDDDDSKLKIHCYRAVLQIILKKMNLGWGKKGANTFKSAHTLPFHEYASLILKKRGLADEGLKYLEDLNHTSLTTQWRNVVVFFVLRLLMGPSIETLLLLDRLFFIHEQGVSQCLLVPLFDPSISPRNTALIAIK